MRHLGVKYLRRVEETSSLCVVRVVGLVSFTLFDLEQSLQILALLAHELALFGSILRLLMRGHIPGHCIIGWIFHRVACHLIDPLLFSHYDWQLGHLLLLCQIARYHFLPCCFIIGCERIVGSPLCIAFLLCSFLSGYLFRDLRRF